jgi:MFS-type transporter involved in bile tolerance (Atg22 family)
MRKKAFEEYGKSLLNFSVAILIFAILQPVINEKINILQMLTFGIIYLVVVFVGMIFINLGEENDSKQ